MIKNRTRYTEDDIRLICGNIKINKKFVKKTVISLIIDFLFVIYCVYLCFRFSSGEWFLSIGNLGCLIILASLIFACYNIYKSIFGIISYKKNRLNRIINNSDIDMERYMELSEKCIVVTTEKNGVVNDRKFGCELVKGYLQTRDSIYIKTVLNDQQEVYIILHNDGYIEGSKNETLEYLKKLGVNEVTV